MGIVTKDILKLSEDVAADPIANELLGAKCNLEKRSRTAVLRDYGDPRTWENYKERNVKESA